MFAGVFGLPATHCSRRWARCVSGISSSGSLGAPFSVKAGGLAAGLAVGFAAGFAFGFVAGLAFGLPAGLVFGLAAGLALGVALGLATGVVTEARPASRIAVPPYGELSAGWPSWSYGPRTSRSVTVGAPVSTTRVPAAGLWVTTRLDEKPCTDPATCHAKPESSRMPFAKTYACPETDG